MPSSPAGWSQLVKIPAGCGEAAGWGCCRAVAGVWLRGGGRAAAGQPNPL